MTNLRFLNELSIDSLKIRIPIHLIKKVNNTFDQVRHIVTDDGEIINSFKNNSFPIIENGITTRYVIQEIRVSKSVDTFLVILFNSKLLGAKYLEGINKDNIIDIYDSLIAQKIVYFELETFLSSFITDIDIKMDSIINDYESMFKTMKENTIPDKRAHHGCKPFNQTGNLGIQWSDRRKATISNPYLKMYHKGVELRNNSIEFFECYIEKNIDLKLLDNCIRTEFTLKNKKHLNKFKLENNLKALLETPQSKLRWILQSISSRHISKLPRKKKVSKSISVSDQKCLNAMRHFLLTEKKRGLRGFIHMYTEDLPDRTKRRTANQCEKLYDDHIILHDFHEDPDIDFKEWDNQLNNFYSILGL